jgi:hypothetical protein
VPFCRKTAEQDERQDGQGQGQAHSPVVRFEHGAVDDPSRRAPLVPEEKQPAAGHENEVHRHVEHIPDALEPGPLVVIAADLKPQGCIGHVEDRGGGLDHEVHAEEVPENRLRSPENSRNRPEEEEGCRQEDAAAGVAELADARDLKSSRKKS